MNSSSVPLTTHSRKPKPQPTSESHHLDRALLEHVISTEAKRSGETPAFVSNFPCLLTAGPPTSAPPASRTAPQSPSAKATTQTATAGSESSAPLHSRQLRPPRRQSPASTATPPHSARQTNAHPSPPARCRAPNARSVPTTCAAVNDVKLSSATVPNAPAPEDENPTSAPIGNMIAAMLLLRAGSTGRANRRPA